jgi:hypothetical protein
MVIVVVLPGVVVVIVVIETRKRMRGNRDSALEGKVNKVETDADGCGCF